MKFASYSRRLILPAYSVTSLTAIADELPETPSEGPLETIVPSSSAIEPVSPVTQTPVSAQLTCQYVVTSEVTFDGAVCTQEILQGVEEFFGDGDVAGSELRDGWSKS